MLKQTCSLIAYNDLIFNTSKFNESCKKILPTLFFLESLSSLRLGKNDNIQKLLDTESRNSTDINQLKAS